MFEPIDALIREAATQLWGFPMLIFLSIVGIYFTLRLKGLQFRCFLESARLAYRYRTGKGEGNISPLQSLFSALGGVIGNGNLGGVATAIAVGGPGAVFWLWVASLVAMILVYAETYLAVFQREKSVDGTYSGGPMYYIEKLLGLRWLAVLFALAMGLKTLLATSTIQSNSIALAFQSAFDSPLLPVCIGLSILTLLVTIGGLDSIARTLGRLTPFMVILYFAAGIALLVFNWEMCGKVLHLVVSSAFTPRGAAGGFAGASVLMAIRYGVARGFYSNEAGTGSSPIMYSTAKTDDPENLALIGMFGVVIDTIVGTLTAFIILSTGVWTSGETSTALTTSAFGTFLGSSGGYFVFLTSFLFGYSTLVAWSFYGEQCFAYIWGSGVRKLYRWMFCVAICFGFLEAELLWSWGDLLNGVTVLINVVAVSLLIRFNRHFR
jgi:AGCS family alanine or glycine:cation symporter